MYIFQTEAILSSAWIKDWLCLCLCLWPAVQFWGKWLNFCRLYIFQLENWVILNPHCQRMREFGTRILECIWRMDAVKDTTELQRSRQPKEHICHALRYHPCRAFKKLWICRGEAFPRALKTAVKDSTSCKWARDPISLGSTKDFCEAGLGFFLNPVRKPLLYCALGKPCWNNVTGKEATEEKMVLLQTKKIKSLLLHSKGIRDN